MCHGLAEIRSDLIQDNIDQVVVSHLATDIESIYIVELFLDSTCLPKITDLAKSPVWLIGLAIVLPNGVLNLFTGSISMTVWFLPFQCFTLCT